ncbi:MAG: hypothetical protein HY665_03360 [Chloroflexi bacterium]|nr:hypothetical protein [Chloroflexota bacterium]
MFGLRKTNIQAEICAAIGSKLLIKFRYRACNYTTICVAEPYCYGLVSHHDERLLCYQVDGYVTLGDPGGWRLFRSSGISKLEVTNEHFTPVRSGLGYDQRYVAFTKICGDVFGKTPAVAPPANPSGPEQVRDVQQLPLPSKPAERARDHNYLMRLFRLSHLTLPFKRGG